MLWSKLQRYWQLNSVEPDCYIDYIPVDGYVFKIEEDGVMYSTDYMQLVVDVEDGITSHVFVFQIESSEEPINIKIETDADHTIIPIKIFKQILEEITVD